jgi:hypothetical protein
MSEYLAKAKALKQKRFVVKITIFMNLFSFPLFSDKTDLVSTGDTLQQEEFFNTASNPVWKTYFKWCQIHQNLLKENQK